MTIDDEHPKAARIAVIGGGFSGAVFALHLARKTTHPTAITVVEPRPSLGAGVAYGSPDPAHRINVPAARMILFPEDPTHFDRWFRGGPEIAADPDAIWEDGHAYPRRAAFGRYVAELVAAAAQARPHVTIAHRQARATAVLAHDGAYTVALDDGGRVTADLVAIATSHPPPSPPSIITAALGNDPSLIADPWVPEALATIGRDESVLIVGTGLTMADVVASLTLRGHRGKIHAFSRRGLLSRGHAAYSDAVTWFTDHEPPGTTLALLREIRTQIAAAAQRGLPWQAVIDDVRGNGRRVWGRLDPPERRRLLRHLRSFWDVHRYRVAPQIEAAIGRRRADGSLRVLAASLRSLRRVGAAIEVALQPRFTRAEALERFSVDKVIVTTGPSHGSIIDQTPALAGLARQGLLQADPFGLGIAVDRVSQVLRADGSSDPTLLVVGPLAREQYGELMGLPQVSAHATEIAVKVAGWIDQRFAAEGRPPRRQAAG